MAGSGSDSEYCIRLSLAVAFGLLKSSSSKNFRGFLDRCDSRGSISGSALAVALISDVSGHDSGSGIGSLSCCGGATISSCTASSSTIVIPSRIGCSSNMTSRDTMTSFFASSHALH